MPAVAFCCVIPGAPIAKGRPRFAKRGAFMQVYTPEKTRVGEDAVRYAVSKKWGDQQPIDEAIRAEVHAYLPIPASWSKKKQQQAADNLIYPTAKPDIDNYLKAAIDACNTIVFRDDALIVDLITRKRYSTQPRLELVFTLMKDIAYDDTHRKIPGLLS